MDPTSPYDALLAKHLRSVPQDRLYVGEDLQHVNWAGVEMAFGLTLRGLPEASILAFYDDSVLGRGRLGFLVSDDFVVYVQRNGKGQFALADVEGVDGAPNALVVELRGSDGEPYDVTLRVDEWAARASVERWLSAVARHNRGGAARRRALQGGSITASHAIGRLEQLAAARKLTGDHRDRLRALVDRINFQDGRS